MAIENATFGNIVRKAREADKWGLIFEKGVVDYGTMKKGGVIKFSSGKGKSCIYSKVEFIRNGDEWTFSPDININVSISGIDMDVYCQFLERFMIILKAVAEFLSS